MGNTILFNILQTSRDTDKDSVFLCNNSFSTLNSLAKIAHSHEFTIYLFNFVSLVVVVVASRSHEIYPHLCVCLVLVCVCLSGETLNTELMRFWLRLKFLLFTLVSSTDYSSIGVSCVFVAMLCWTNMLFWLRTLFSLSGVGAVFRS